MSLMRLGRLDVDNIGSRLILAGRLDDLVSLAEIPSRMGPGPIVIDTAAVTFVTSPGLREWVRLIRVLRDQLRLEVRLERVAELLMVQLNLIPDLAREIAIVSFHAPYGCAQCGEEVSPLIEVAEHLPELRAQRAPILPCPACGSPMEMSEFPERYLSVFQA